MLMKNRSADTAPYLAVKDVVLARSGEYLYSYDEITSLLGERPKQVKPYYTVYRPPAVLIKNKDKFAFTAFTTNHTKDETTPDNFPEQGHGVVGDAIEVTYLENGEVALKGRAAIFSRRLMDHIESGAKETSADYRQAIVESDDPRWDYKMVDIKSVNGVAVVQRGRGGELVRVLDAISDRQTWRPTMAGILSKLFGASDKRSKDTEGVPYSKTLIDALEKIQTLGDKGSQKEIAQTLDSVMEPLGKLRASEELNKLASIVKESFDDITMVLGDKEKFARIVDEQYKRCLDTDAKDEDDEDEDEEDSKGETKDAESMEAVVARLLDERLGKLETQVTRALDAVPALLDKKLKSILGTDPEKGAHSQDSAMLDILGNASEDTADFLTDYGTIFDSRRV